MLVKKNKGFTLIELVVALTIFFICISMSIGIITLALAQKATTTQMLTIQDNFSSVCATITSEIKSAYWREYTGAEPNAFLVYPKNAVMCNELILIIEESGSAHRIRYSTETNVDGATRIWKEDALMLSTSEVGIYGPMLSTGEGGIYGPPEKYPLTPYLNQIASVYFVNSKGKITIIMNAKIKINGEENDVTFVDTAYARNSAY